MDRKYFLFFFDIQLLFMFVSKKFKITQVYAMYAIRSDAPLGLFYLL
jgi:hypothetical protein